jgi:RNA polymerase sigma factor (sigma-70 family)
MNQPQNTSVTAWIADLKQGDSEAAEQLFKRYFESLIRLAEKHVKQTRQRGVDAEDVADHAFADLVLGAPQGRFPKLTDRQSLWNLLIAITKHKAADAIRRETRAKRGGGRVRGESILTDKHGDGRPQGFASVIGNQPTPDDFAQYTDELARLLEHLDRSNPGGDLRQILLRRIQGETIDEIAAALDVVPETIQRRLKRIRVIWIAVAFDDAWKSGEPPCIDEFLELVDGKNTQSDLLRKLLPMELKYRNQSGGSPKLEDYQSQFPEFLNVINLVFKSSG